MFEIIGSLLTGGATGLLGTLMTGTLDYFERRQAHRNELDLRRLDIELAQTEAAGAERRATIEMEGVVAQAETEVLAESYREAGRRWSGPGDGLLLQCVDVVRGLMRPALTVTFVALTGAIYLTLTPVDGSVRSQVIATVLYLTTTCVIWWFGGRRRQPVSQPTDK